MYIATKVFEYDASGLLHQDKNKSTDWNLPDEGEPKETASENIVKTSLNTILAIHKQDSRPLRD